MDTTSRQIEQHIQETRVSLRSNLDELELRVKAATDWRHQFRTRPMSFLGLALAGGALLAAVGGAGTYRRPARRLAKGASDHIPHSEGGRRDTGVAGQVWNNVKGAIVATASTRLLDFANATFGGIIRKP